MLRNGLEPWHLLIVAVVLIALFGSRRLRLLGVDTAYESTDIGDPALAARSAAEKRVMLSRDRAPATASRRAAATGRPGPGRSPA
ncbi:Mut7-C RNAse domain-containing protein, partial [Streptomyces olivaceoviridis]